ncbi:HPP family protein [Massilia sp. 9096]|uniref:HPP family protein n=1 Tax=Massilia sp. 9096 TaxID=1500894 RepID=UPI00055C9DAB|nr:HPP family protein [Massilia sp. 9096]
MNKSVEWLRSFVPQPNTVPPTERLRAVAGALVGLLVTVILSGPLAAAGGTPVLVAPMGASAVLLFCVPASSLAQPWSVIGGNTISALVGITVAHAVHDPVLAAPLAGALAILVMFLLRCLHPPSGAVALTAVLGGPAVYAAGFHFAFLPVCLNSTLIVLAALVFNNLTGRRYPHPQGSNLKTSVHATRDPAPTARLGFTAEDLDAALAHYGQVLDISRDDLETILLETEQRAFGRRFGVIDCAAIMSKDAVTVTPDTPLHDAWRQLRGHRLDALPVLDALGRVAGVVSLGDFVQHAGLDAPTLGQRLRALLGHLLGTLPQRPGTVGQVMHARVTCVRADAPIADLVPLMSNRGLHHIPVVDADGRFVGVVGQSDLLGALFENSLHA